MTFPWLFKFPPSHPPPPLKIYAINVAQMFGNAILHLACTLTQSFAAKTPTTGTEWQANAERRTQISFSFSTFFPFSFFFLALTQSSQMPSGMSQGIAKVTGVGTGTTTWPGVRVRIGLDSGYVTLRFN